tara:strand:+ start:526 stop:1446 length:921 start_codon:yes stop_codon:yes gene_type:complete
MNLNDENYIDNNSDIVGGVDEVGRGPLCGPVVAAAVILPKNSIIDGVDDSKKLSPKKRESLFDIINEQSLSVGIGIVHEDRIDHVNILSGTMIAMKNAVDNLSVTPNLLLVDGNMKDITDIPQKNIIKGDSKSLSIAAASIIAKVTRDRMMVEYDKIFPNYGLARNMGYGTKEHLSAIKKNFSTPIHRKSFKPVLQYMPKFGDILDRRILSIDLAACKLVKAGHRIISIKNKNLKIIDIISLSNNQYYVFKLYNDSKEDLDIIKNQIVNECKTILLENNITSSINISVISVQFSKDKPKITFKDIS